MTETRRWIENRRHGLLRRHGLGAALVLVGLTAFALGAGVWLGRWGAYRLVPELTLLGWALVAAALVLGTRLAVRTVRAVHPASVARALESAGGLRRGTVTAFAVPDGSLGSAALTRVADRRTADWLAAHGGNALAPLQRQQTRSLARGSVVAAAGLAVFAASAPATRHAGFWTPLATIARARGPVTLTADRAVVRRGDSVTVRVRAAGRSAAVLYVRAPGEAWQPRPLLLDSAGHAEAVLGPLESDRFLRAASGGRESDTLHVRVAVPAFVADLTLLAAYPAYLGLPDEALQPGRDTLLLPVGTMIRTEGRATVALAEAQWAADGAAVPLTVEGSRFRGSLPVTRSARWVLRVAVAGDAALEGEPAELTVRAVPDSAPVVSAPVPGADTLAPVSLRQPLVVDVRDDHRVTRVEVVSRRVSRLGVAGTSRTETIPLPAEGVERAVLQWQLDLNDRGFLPGDTAYFRVRAADNRPAPQWSETREYALRLPSMAELRAAARDEARGLTAAADSLAARQAELARATEELAREGRRTSDEGSGERQQADFRAAERAGEVARDQGAVLDRAQQLQERLAELQEAAWEAGLTDPEWHRQIEELQQLLERAITPEMQEIMRQLQEAMDRLDPSAMQDALQRLAEAQRRLREELERSRELFERAALEGEMTTLADEAEELAARQEEWNRRAEQGTDSSMAAVEQALAEATDSLADRLAELERSLEAAGRPEQAQRGEQAEAAAAQMRQAARAAQRGEQRAAQRAGRQASAELGPLAEQLRQQRDEMRSEWRQEVLDAIDRALVETAQLARRQEELNRQLERGETGSDVRAAQGAVRDGVDRVIERLRAASGRNALVSPRLATALGLAKLRMTGAVDQLQRANPNLRGAQSDAGEALDGLNAVAHQLLRSRGDVAGAQSGSGLQEAMERMAQMAQQQNALANQAGGLLPLMQQGGELLMQELRMMAQRQRQLAQELERMRGEGTAPGELAEEARDLARQLESGVLDRAMVERQERLYRRLLDAGRMLRGNEDAKEDRISESGRLDHTRTPEAGRRAADGPAYRYPSWEELQRLSPEERRLILDYFRRLNERGGR